MIALPLMINRRPIIRVKEPWMAPRFPDLRGNSFFVQFNPKAGFGGQIDKPITHDEWLAQIPLALMNLFLGQKIGNGCVLLQTGGQ